MREKLRRPYEDPRIRELLQAANDSARLFRTIFVSFVIIALYLLVIALSANDELLFKNQGLRAPIVNVSVQASHYFIAAPWLLLLLHFNLLVQAVFLANKITDYERAVRSSPNQFTKNEMLRLTYPIPMTQMSGSQSAALPSLVLRLFVCVTLALLPVVCLGIIQTQFLDYQDFGITLMHSGVLVLDLAAIVYLWPKVKVFHSRQGGARVHLVSAVAGLMVLVFLVVGPVYSMSFLDGATAAGGTWLQGIRPLLTSLHSLDVQDKRLYVGAESTLPSDACSASDTTLALNLTRRSFRGANLSNSILCSAVMVEAQLQRATLVNVQFQRADLRDAQLQGAILGNAQFEAAILIRANLQDVIAAGERLRIQGGTLPDDLVSVERVTGAQFEGADLTSADLRGATLANSILSNAVMNGAQLARANLVNADFEGADLRDAQLQGAIIGNARFEAANLRGANLQDAVAAGEGESLRVRDLDDEEEVGSTRLSGAVFERADLTGAKLQGAMLPNSRFQGALLTEAQLQATVLGAADLRRVDFEGAVLTGAIIGPARLQGANMKKAQLQGAFLGNAQLQGVDLTDAKLQGANLTGGLRYGAIFRNAQLQGANLVNGWFHGADMRGVQLQGATLDNTDLVGADLEGAQLQGVGPPAENPQGGFRGRLYNRAVTPSELGGVSFRDEEIFALVVVLEATQMREDGVSEDIVGDFVRRMFEHLAREGRLEMGLGEMAERLRELRGNDALEESSRQFLGEIGEVVEEIVGGRVRREPIFVEGVYSEEDAEGWVGEYFHEVCEAFRGDWARLESHLGVMGIGESEIEGWEEECPSAPSTSSATE